MAATLSGCACGALSAWLLPAHSMKAIRDCIGYAAKLGGKIVLPRRIKPGSVLVREWKSKSHRVTVLEDGFVYDGDTYSNLSEIAVLITGTKWNGPRFFGLRTKTKESEERAASDRSDRKAETTSVRSSRPGGESGYRKRNAAGTGKSDANGGPYGH